MSQGEKELPKWRKLMNYAEKGRLLCFNLSINISSSLSLLASKEKVACHILLCHQPPPFFFFLFPPPNVHLLSTWMFDTRQGIYRNIQMTGVFTQLCARCSAEPLTTRHPPGVLCANLYLYLVPTPRPELDYFDSLMPLLTRWNPNRDLLPEIWIVDIMETSAYRGRPIHVHKYHNTGSGACQGESTRICSQVSCSGLPGRKDCLFVTA